MEPNRRAVGTLLVLALLTLSGATGAAGAQGGSPSSTAPSSPVAQSWWNNQFAYRKSITITNPTSSPVTDSPVFILVNFPFSHLSDGAAELRLVSQSGTEVPTYLLDEISSNAFVSSAWLLTFASIPASSSDAMELYYGNPTAAVPAYRIDNSTSSARAGPLSVGVSTSQPASTSFQVTFAGTYSEQILSRVSYEPGALHDYGASGIAQTPAAVVSPLAYVANVSSSVVALSSAYSAGALRYTQAFVLDNGTLVDARLLTNTAGTTLNATSLTDVVDSSSLAALGPTTSSYNSTSGLLATAVSGGYFGYASSSMPSSFEVGDSARVVADGLNGDLSNKTSAAGTAGALSWDLGSLAPGASTQLVSAWGVARSYGALEASLQGDSGLLKVAMGQEESYASTESQVTSTWNVTIPIANASVGAAGLSIPIELDNAAPVASRLSFSGTASYVLPDGYASPSTQAGWIPQAAQTGSTYAYSTTAFYSLQELTYTGSVRVTGNGTGSGAAQLVSPTMSLPASVSKHFVLRYRALFTGGDLSGQWLYAAVDASETPNGPFAQTVAVMVAGSSPSINGSGCQSLPLKGAPTSPQNDNVTYSGALVADGSWRTLGISLEGAVGSSAPYLRVRFCVASTTGYVGQLELDVATAGIEATSNAPGFVSASVAPGGRSLDLAFLPGATYEPSNVTVNGVVSFPALENVPLKWDGTTAYNATIVNPSLVSQTDPVDPGDDKDPSAASSANAIFVGATISTPPAFSAPEVLVNGTAVPALQVGDAVYVNSSDIAAGQASSFRAADVALSFAGLRLDVTVEDSNGNPLSNADITLESDGFSPVAEPATGQDGSDSMMLLPSAYSVTAEFQGTSVGSAAVNLTSDQSVVVPTGVYSVPIQVKDVLGAPVAGASITVSRDSAEYNLTSDSKGMASFRAVPNEEYNVTVSIAGSTYYTGTILASAERATFELGTSYLPTSMQILIVGGVAISMVAASLALYLARRRPRV